MGFIQPWHLVVILIVALMIFGPRTLGELGGSLGRSIREFKSSLSGEDDVKGEKPTDAAATSAKPHGTVK